MAFRNSDGGSHSKKDNIVYGTGKGTSGAALLLKRELTHLMKNPVEGLKKFIF
jgi:hypothetical protein